MKRHRRIGFLFLLPALLPSLLDMPPLFGQASSDIAPGYGEVIYELTGKNPNQLFIIGMSHRDALSKTNGNNTSRVQAELYKIGEWLVQNRALELLLPEGYFKNGSEKTVKEKVRAQPAARGNCPDPSDMKALENMLSDDSVYVNAEMLLKRNYGLRLQQVEEKEFYDAVRQGILKLINNPGSSCDYPVVKSELDYLQERRTAAMLQRIPEVIEEEFRQGNIRERKAIFTIGLSHLHGIINYLNKKKITIYPPLLTQEKGKDWVADVNLLKEGFGVSAIIPKTLADDLNVMKANRLEKIAAEYRSKNAVFLGRTSGPLSSAGKP